MEKILPVPYYSQYLDIEDKMDAITSCGMICVKMILDYHNIKSKSLAELIGEGKSNGGYNHVGWVHDYFVDLFKQHNLSSHRIEKANTLDGIAEIRASLDKGNPVICSVAKRLFDKRVYHMILLIGYKESVGGDIEGLYYHNPESTSRDTGSNVYVSLDDFIEYWRHMAIFAKQNN